MLPDLINAGYIAPGSDGIVTAIKADISREQPEILMIAVTEGKFF